VLGTFNTRDDAVAAAATCTHLNEKYFFVAEVVRRVRVDKVIVEE
jgi:hypothetical protein